MWRALVPSSTPAGSPSTRAGPPSRYVVYLESGSFSSRRPLNLTLGGGGGAATFTGLPPFATAFAPLAPLGLSATPARPAGRPAAARLPAPPPDFSRSSFRALPVHSPH